MANKFSRSSFFAGFKKNSVKRYNKQGNLLLCGPVLFINLMVLKRRKTENFQEALLKSPFPLAVSYKNFSSIFLPQTVSE